MSFALRVAVALALSLVAVACAPFKAEPNKAQSSEARAADDPGPDGDAVSDQTDPTTPPAPPSPKKATPLTSPRPTEGVFEALDIRYPVGAGQSVTQCIEGADEERVWTTMSSGKNDLSRWGEPKNERARAGSCGVPIQGHYPLVLRSEVGTTALSGTWITRCAPERGVAHVFRVESGGYVDGHPVAPFLYNETDASCE